MKALVTGGSGLIGSAICEALASEGLHVLVHANQNLDRARQVVEKIRSAGQSAETACFDVSDRKATSHHLENILESGPVQVLVNNAGITQDNLLVRMKDEEWNSVLNTNLTSIYRLSKSVLRSMMKSRYGKIINISSVVGHMGNAGQTNYVASKAGITGFTKSLAQEVGNRGITVNCVAPGFIDTDMTKSLSDEQKEKLLSHIPLSRLGNPLDIAKAVVFLASDDADYITGETIHINGGMLMA